MKVAIFGGTGQTGRFVVEKALAAGHEVKVLARTPSKLALQHENLHVLAGDVLDAERVDEVITGTDAVISILAPPSNEPTYIISQGMENIIDAMKRHGVQRIVASAGAGVRMPDDQPNVIDKVVGVALNVFSKHVVEDMRRVVAKLQASGLDWTVVRAPKLTDKPAQGNLKVGYVGEIDPFLAREDMAAFMLEQVNESRWVGKAPALSN